MDAAVVTGLYVEASRHLYPDRSARPFRRGEEGLVLLATELTAEFKFGRQWSAAPVAVELACLLDKSGTAALLMCLGFAGG
jgi:hypothetical protein